MAPVGQKPRCVDVRHPDAKLNAAAGPRRKLLRQSRSGGEERFREPLFGVRHTLGCGRSGGGASPQWGAWVVSHPGYFGPGGRHLPSSPRRLQGGFGMQQVGDASTAVGLQGPEQPPSRPRLLNERPQRKQGAFEVVIVQGVRPRRHVDGEMLDTIESILLCLRVASDCTATRTMARSGRTATMLRSARSRPASMKGPSATPRSSASSRASACRWAT